MMTNDELLSRITEAQANLDRAWEQTEKLLADMYYAERGPQDDAYSTLAYACDEYLMRACMVMDDAVWKVRRLANKRRTQ